MMNSEKMLYECPFKKITFLPRIDANSGFGRDRDTIWKLHIHSASNEGI